MQDLLIYNGIGVPLFPQRGSANEKQHPPPRHGKQAVGAGSQPLAVAEHVLKVGASGPGVPHIPSRDCIDHRDAEEKIK